MLSMRRLAPATIAASAIAVLLAFASSASAAYQWESGTVKESTITNCASIIFGNPYTENGAGAWVSEYVDPNNLPHVGDTWYGAIDVAGLGDPCAGTYAHLEVAPPRSSSTAVTPGTPIFCYLGQLGGSSSRDTTDCPANFENGFAGGYALNPTTGNGVSWPLPQGYFVEIQYPMTSSAVLSGIGHNPCDCLAGFAVLADGNSSPTLTPTLGIFTQPGAGTGGGLPGGTGGSNGVQTNPTPQNNNPAPNNNNTNNTNPGPNVVPGPTVPTASAASVAGSIKAAAAEKKGLPVTVTNNYDGSTDDVTVLGQTGAVHKLSEAKARTKKLGHVVVSGQHKGAVSLKVKLSKSGVKAVLGKKKKAKVQVLITVSALGHQPSTIAKFVTLKA